MKISDCLVTVQYVGSTKYNPRRARNANGQKQAIFDILEMTGKNKFELPK
jgi:hypothetical protein